MTNLVLTALGDDRPGLVDALAAAVADHDGNWERAQMTRLAGKFAGIVLIAVPAEQVSDLRTALGRLGDAGVLEVDAVEAGDDAPEAFANAVLSISGTDRPGVLREMAGVLARRSVSIETLDTTTTAAPMAGGLVFEADADLVVPGDIDLDVLRVEIEDAVPGFLVHVEAVRVG